MGQNTGTLLFLTVRKEKEQRQKMVASDESNVICAKIDKLTSIIENLLLSTSSPNHSNLQYIRVKEDL